ncbi:type IV pilus minor pilin PilX [Geotalea daltonii FRC-32]|uniref:Type IV pilus minor pilin PilX n=1 Tax=Geotalea daltonii (strain DSM 22248 / JCM 15807 / FRC-32) TaxID=316067 RepID=B9M3J5_GEODF|nr:hypothetical protein [Geotalea daltonii]ACM21416.1 type IV pilus minor pilin PilX [Geotalea daltonii FRC-32]
MRCLRNENGVALVTALMLTLISLVICLTLLYYITQGTYISAANKRYKTSLEAAHGGVQVFAKDIIPKIFGGYSTNRLMSEFSGINLDVPVTNACLQQKLRFSTSEWTNCITSNSDPNAKVSPDVTFHLKGMPSMPGFVVNSKIVDTTAGNTDTSSGGAENGEKLIDPIGVAYNPGGSLIGVPHLPYIYRIEVESEAESNAKERARLSVLYAY